MSNTDVQLLKRCLRQLLQRENLDEQRQIVQMLTTELNTNCTDCAAALLYVMQNAPVILLHEPRTAPPLPAPIPSPIKMLRYRLDVGSKHQVTQAALKKLLIDESGVDKNNINYISIREDHTIVELPDAMPLDIFQHLKNVEINHHKLGIRRVKARNISTKKRGGHHCRRGRGRTGKSTQAV